MTILMTMYYKLIKINYNNYKHMLPYKKKEYIDKKL